MWADKVSNTYTVMLSSEEGDKLQIRSQYAECVFTLIVVSSKPSLCHIYIHKLYITLAFVFR